MITGDPGTPFFFPLNKVRWQADPIDTAIMCTGVQKHSRTIS